MTEAITPYTRQQLEALRAKPPENGYQTATRERLVLSRLQLGRMALRRNIRIPYGPWFINDHPNRDGVDPNKLDAIITAHTPAKPDQTERWRQEGYLIDEARGLPLHPRFKQLIRTVGMYAGPGFNYRYGPQRATNLGLRAVEGDQVYYLLIKTFTRNTWSLPGGYQDPGETLVEGAFREAKEESGIILPASFQQGLTVVSTSLPPSGAYRDTMHSWMEQHFHFAQTQATMDRQAFGALTPEDTAEIQAIRWCTLEEIESGTIHGFEDIPDLPVMSSHRNRIVQNELSLAA